MSEFQIRDGNLIASFDLENEDGDIDCCKLFKVTHGVANEIGMFVDYVATNKIIKDQSIQLAEKDQAIESLEELNRSLGQTCNNDRKEIERLNKLLAEKENQYNQLVFNSKYTSEEMIDFSVEQLEKVKEWCEDNYDICDDTINNCKGKVIGLDKVIFNADTSLYDFIDNQIKLLKEGK